MQKELKRLSEELNYPYEKLPKIDNHNELAIPYLYIFEKENFYHYVVNERGEEYERKVFSDIDPFLHHIFCNITFEMATDFEKENRIENQDCRIIIFRKQEELMTMLNKELKNRIR